MLKAIRGGKGLGDALYVQAVARHITQRERLRVATSWPDVFRPLGDKVEIIPFTRTGIDYLAHYSLRKGFVSDQFTDCCVQAGVREPIHLRLDWTIGDRALIERLRSYGKPIVLVQLPRAPMGRTDGFGQELLPDCRAIQRAIDTMRGRVLLVQVGSGAPQYRFKGIDIDLAQETTVSQLIDLAAACDGVLGYVSFLLPLAESLEKRAMMVWSRRGLKSATTYVRQITPAKVVHRKDLVTWSMDAAEDRVETVATAFLESLCDSLLRQA